MTECEHMKRRATETGFFMECAAAYVSDTLCAPVHTAHLNIVQTLHLAYH
jgi:hypothetical protein